MGCVADINIISTLFLERWYGGGGLFWGEFGKVTNSNWEYETPTLLLSALLFFRIFRALRQNVQLALNFRQAFV